MESWLQRVVLVILMGFSGALCFEVNAQERNDETLLGEIINPDIERREIDEDKIDSEDFEFGIYAGVISIEDFGSSDVFGVRFAYHVTEDWFLEFTYGLATAGETSFETLSGSTPLLTEEQRELSYYNLDLGFNLFPGEVYIGKWAFNTNLYIVAGAGNTLFADDEFFTYNFGGGFRFFATDWIALHFDVRNHILTHNIFGDDKEVQNLETNIGLTLFF